MKIIRFKKILSYYKPYRKDLLLDLLYSIIQSICITCIPLLARYIMSEIINFESNKAFCSLLGLSLLILALFIIIMLCKKYIEYQGKILAAKVESDIKIEIFRHFQKQNFAFFDERKTGGLVSYITTDAYNLTAFTKRFPEKLLDFLIRLVGMEAVLYLTAPLFGLIIFGVLAIIFSIVIYFIPKIQKSIIKYKSVYSELTSNLEESLSGIKTVQSFTNEKKEFAKFKNDINTYLKAQKESLKLSSTADAIIEPIVLCLTPAITITAMFFILAGQFDLNNLITFILYTDILIAPLATMISLIEGLNESIAGIERIFDVLSTKPEIIDSPKAINLEKVKGNIRFSNVSFKYKTGREILKNLNFEIKSGDYIALVGKSGIGKSTICNLIPRFYEVTKGKILIDEKPVKNISLQSLRKNIGFVQQDAFLFSGTIAENILYGNLKSSEEEIIEAAKSAYAHNFIAELKNGYNTAVGERGVKLSGGQKQRIAIARIFLKNPPILIFDEPTSNLDNESEYLIQKSMEKLFQNRTTIVIAHRLSTIKNAKRILVLTKNGIEEEGTHKSLLTRNGVYSDLYRLQL